MKVARGRDAVYPGLIGSQAAQKCNFHSYFSTVSVGKQINACIYPLPCCLRQACRLHKPQKLLPPRLIMPSRAKVNLPIGGRGFKGLVDLR
jgi:hypothetical protein